MYENVTYEEIRDRMLARVPNKFDKREGSVIWDTHSPTAIELQILYLELDAILRNAYGDTASREFLILRCRERGIYPHEATRAVLRGVFTPETIDMTGKRFNIGDLNYIVTGKATDGKGGYEVQCETAGITGNQFFGSIIPIEYIQGLQGAELTEILIPGEDEEDTEDLRTRYFDSFEEHAFGGNVRDYLEKTNAIPGVGRTKVARVWNGDISPVDMLPGESVETWYNGIKGTLGGEVKCWLDSVFHAAKEKKLTTGGAVLLAIINSEFAPASDALVLAVQTAIDPEENAGEGYGLAPIGHVVTVRSASPVRIDVKTSLVFDEGYGWNSLMEPIRDAIDNYLLELRQKWADSTYLVIRLSQIEARILAVKGVADIEEALLNGKAANMTLGAYEIPVLGGVTHEQGS